MIFSLDDNLFAKTWEKLEEDRSQFYLEDVFTDSPEIKGLAIHLIDRVYLTIWETGETSIADLAIQCPEDEE